MSMHRRDAIKNARPAESAVTETSQPFRLGEEGKEDGNKTGVHLDHSGRPADGSDRAGLHRGSGVLDRSGSDPTGGQSDAADPLIPSPTPASPAVVDGIAAGVRLGADDEGSEVEAAVMCDHGAHVRGCQSCDEDAERFIASRLGPDWLAAHVATARAEAWADEWDVRPLIDRRLAEAKAEALREAADAWQQGEWADPSRRADRVQERLADAQRVTDWLRARADREATP